MRLLHAWSTTLCPCILVVLGACADSDSDVRHVSTLPILTLHEDLRIGSAEDPDSGFSRIAAAEIGPDSSLYVLESMANEVRIFDYHGRRVGTIGRAGAGPGEFRLLGRLGFAGDTLWVWDAGNRRISWFDRSGQLLMETPTRIRIPVDLGVSPPPVPTLVTPTHVRGDGFIGSEEGQNLGAATAQPPDSFRIPVVRFDRTGSVVDTIAWQWTSFPRRIATHAGLPGVITVNSGIVESPVRVHDHNWSFVFRWHDDAQDTGVLELVKVGSSSDTVYRRLLRYDLNRIPASYGDSIVRRYGDMASRMNGDRGVVEEAVRGAMRLPRSFPPFTDYRIGSDGSVWLQLRSATDSANWAVIDPRGKPAGRVSLPHEVSPLWIGRGFVWAVHYDHVDVPWLVRLRPQDDI
jgi:hypothetical protein